MQSTLGKNLADSRWLNTQALGGILIGVSGDNLTKIDSVEIPVGVGFIAHRLCQGLRHDVIAVHRPAFIVHKAFLNDRGSHLAAGAGRQMHLLKLVVLPS